MKKLLLTGVCIAVLAACSDQATKPSTTESTATVETAVAEKTLISGIDYSNMDKSVRPQDDLYRHVGGNWLKNFEIPADRSNYGSFTKLQEESQRNLRTIIEESAKTESEKGSETQKVGDYYRAFMDEEKIEALGIQPLMSHLAFIHDLKTHDDIFSAFISLGKKGVGSPIGLFVNQDRKDSTRYVSYLWQTGISLPDRDYYLKDDEKSVEIQQKFIKHVEKMFSLSGIDDAATKAKTLYNLEKAIASEHWERVKLRDPNATYNPVEISKLSELAPHLNWELFVDGIGLKNETNVIVGQPSFLKAFDKIFSDTSVEDWKTYLSWNLITTYSGNLSKKFDQENFEFFEKTLSGIEEQKPRWKRAVNSINGSMGEIVGKIYVDRHFKAEAKQRMGELVENLRTAFSIEINKLEWMGDETKKQAQEKLRRFNPKIGYPQKWRDYSALAISGDDLVGNNMRVSEFAFNRNINKLGKPIDRHEWFMTPQTVNAYYNPPMNEIVFPAAILQTPFFNMDADDAVNYGAIGAVIGHEMSHGFDDQGRKTDADGNLRDWWTEEDGKRFDERAKKLAEFYSEFSVLDGKHVKGDFTLGENIADLGGLTIAFKAYKISLNGEPSPVIDGYTGEQRFFMGWSQVWSRKYRDAELAKRIMTDPHSPSEFRANGPIQHMADFYETFALKETDALYRKKEDRIKIW